MSIKCRMCGSTIPALDGQGEIGQTYYCSDRCRRDYRRQERQMWDEQVLSPPNPTRDTI